MVNIEYNLEQNKFQKWYHGSEPARVQCWVIDLNTNLTVLGWYTDFGGAGYAEWNIPEKYYNAEYNSGFEIIACIGEEQVFSKKFQHKKLNNKFYFSSPHNELNFGSWESLVYDEEYDITLTPWDVVYDLGANFGVYTMYALSEGVKQVYAFRPLAVSHRLVFCETSVSPQRNMHFYTLDSMTIQPCEG